MQHHPRQFASDGAVDVFDDGEICREENVEVALLDLIEACVNSMSGTRKICYMLRLELTSGVLTGTVLR